MNEPRSSIRESCQFATPQRDSRDRVDASTGLRGPFLESPTLQPTHEAVTPSRTSETRPKTFVNSFFRRRNISAWRDYLICPSTRSGPGFTALRDCQLRSQAPPRRASSCSPPQKDHRIDETTTGGMDFKARDRKCPYATQKRGDMRCVAHHHSHGPFAHR